MANRVKEDEKNERIIRNLLKLPDNRRCINCNSLGPQYVCTNFWTFVCTTCSGIHREFTHRVKSVSMAKFTSQEVSALQGGGNARAKEIYFKEWDLQRHSFPDSSNVERLRDFIKHVYVDRRYSGDRSVDKPPRVKMGDGEDTYQGGSRSPQYEDTYDRRYSDRPSPGGRSDDRNYRNSYDERRSPGYDQESCQYGDFRRSPGRTEIVNDWRREDRFGNGGRISDGGSKLEGRSPDRQKDLNVSSPPVVRPVREILGDNVSPLRIIEPPKADGSRAVDASVRTQRTASSSSLISSNGNPAEVKKENLGSLIDFDAVPEPPATATASQTQQTIVGQSVSQPTTSSNADNWACFDTPMEVKVTQAPSNANSLESVLLGLSVPASVLGQATGVPGSGSIPTAAPVGNMSAIPSSSNSFGAPAGQTSVLPFGSNSPVAPPVSNLTMFPPVNAPVPAPAGHMPISPFGVGAPAAATMNNLTAFPAGGAPAAAPVLTSVLPSNAVNSPVPNMLPQQHSFYAATGVQPTAQPFTPPINGPSSNQPWNSSITPNTQVPSSIPAAQTLQAVSRAVPAVTAGMVNQSSPAEVKPSGRRELPEDLFTATYRSSVPLPGWQTGHLHGFGFSMQYNNAVPMQTFPQPPKSTNPFDFNNEISPVQAPTFPSMSSLQGALPNMGAPSGLLRTSSLGTPSLAWMPPQSSHPSVMPPQAPSFASAMPPSAYTGQQIPNNLPPRQQSVVGFGGERAPLGTSNLNQQHQQFSGIYSAPATPNSFSTGGNPFG